MSCGQRTLYFLRFEREGFILGSCCVFGCCFPSAVNEAAAAGLVPRPEGDERATFQAVGKRVFPPLVGLVPPEIIGVALSAEQAAKVDWEGIQEVVCR